MSAPERSNAARDAVALGAAVFALVAPAAYAALRALEVWRAGGLASLAPHPLPAVLPPAAYYPRCLWAAVVGVALAWAVGFAWRRGGGGDAGAARTLRRVAVPVVVFVAVVAVALP